MTIAAFAFPSALPASQHFAPNTDCLDLAVPAPRNIAIMDDAVEGKDFSFPAEEEKVLRFWKDIDAFKQQLARSEGKKEYVFFDGPPFATGLPHYGHILAGTLKAR